MTDADRGYGGSRFSDVVDALFANPYQRIWGGEGQPPLPVREVTLRSVLGGILPFAAPGLLRKASEPPPGARTATTRRLRRESPAAKCADRTALSERERRQ